MAINNFKFPGVELHQEFVETPVTAVSQLGVAVVGYQAMINTTSWVYGGTATQIKLSDVPYCAIDNDTYAPTVTAEMPITNFVATGSSTNVKINGSTATERDAEITFNVSVTAGTAAAKAFGEELPAVGDPVKITGTSASTATDGVITYVNSDTIGIGITGIDLTGTTISEIQFKKTSAVVALSGTSVYAEGDDVYLSIPANPTAEIDKNGTASAVTIETAADEYPLYIQYATKKLALGTVGSFTDILGTFGNLTGPVSSALAFALSAAGGNVVNYICTLADTDVSYIRALDFLDKYTNIYSIVPAVAATNADTTANTIIKSCITAVESISADVENKIYRTVWYGIEASNAADAIAARKKIGTSYRAQAVWSDTPQYNGNAVSNSSVAAAAAGMRSYEPSYRPISNLGYNFFSLKEVNGLTKTDLESMGANGIWIVANNYDGTPINMRQLTTAVSNNLNKDEESIVANADSIALTLCHVGENLVGCSNISPDLLVALHDTLTGIMDRYLLNLTGNAYIGPQLLSYTIDRLEQDPVRLDHIYATITCEPPKPFNRFVMTLRIV